MTRILTINELHLGPFYTTSVHVSITHELASADLTCNCDHATPTIRPYTDTTILSVRISVSERSNISTNS